MRGPKKGDGGKVIAVYRKKFVVHIERITGEKTNGACSAISALRASSRQISRVFGLLARLLAPRCEFAQLNAHSLFKAAASIPFHSCAPPPHTPPADITSFDPPPSLFPPHTCRRTVSSRLLRQQP